MRGLSTFEAFKHIDTEGLVEVKGEKLLALQRVLAMMLGDIDAACEKVGVEYMLGGGSCLGAMRHHGFIPWDDDVDINMPHRQFGRFRSQIDSMFPGKYLFEVPGETPGYDLAFPRIRLRGTVERSREDLGKPREDCGVYVDVFYIEDAPSLAVLRWLHGLVSMALGLFYSCRRFADRADQYNDLASGDPETLSAFKRKERIGRLLSFRSTVGWVVAWNRWNSRVHDDRSRYVCVPVGRKHYFGETYRRSNFFPVKKACFEEHEVSVPANCDAYLDNLYGPDYMTPPPEGEREVHVVYEFDLGAYSNGE